MEPRVCSKCGGEGPFPSKGNVCKACHAQRKAKWYQDNKKQIVAQQAEYKRTHPEQQEKSVQAVRAWERRHPEKAKEYQRRYNPKRRKQNS